MSRELDISELLDFADDLLNVAQATKGKETKSFMKNEAKKCAKEEKDEFTSSGAGAGSGVTEAEIKKSFKAGKVYKDKGQDLACRGYSSHPLTHLLNNGFIHKGGRNKTGKETWIEGYYFMEKAERDFEPTYEEDTVKFIDNLLEKHEL